jgi:hypothetical protein
MQPQLTPIGSFGVAFALIVATLSSDQLRGQQQATIESAVTRPTNASRFPDAEIESKEPLSSVQQGQTLFTEAFTLDAQRWRQLKRRDALRDTQFRFNPRTYYFDQNGYDGSEKQSLAIGGLMAFKTGYFFDHLAFGATGYTSQHLYGATAKDGARLLAPGQQGYSVLGEFYADCKITDDLDLYVGRKEFDTPYINGQDNRMTPNTFEALVLQGKTKLGEQGATLKYGLGYFDKIKNRDADAFIAMSVDAGATVDRGVFTAGGLYQQGNFSFGAIDYYSQDIINIAYAEAKLALQINDEWKPTLAFQFTDQRSVGDALLQGGSFSVQQVGLKADLPVGSALFTAAYTKNTDGASIRDPWGGYVGYTSGLVEDFLRPGEGAFLLQVGCEVPGIEGLRAKAAWLHGSDPDGASEFARDEVDLDLQWAAPKGPLKGLALRLRYAIAEQHGGNADYTNEIRVIANYTINF